jgi:hypothetical protein
MHRFQINLNGNPPEHFDAAARRLGAALRELNDALSDVQSLSHGRNYQTVEGSWEAQSADRQALTEAWTCLRQIEQLAMAFSLAAAKQREERQR